MANGDCTVGAQLTERIVSITKRADELHDVDQEQWTAINQLRNRLPVWATFVISGLTAAIGVLVTLLVA